MTSLALKSPTTVAEWEAYHAIRRRVLFELRGVGASYDANHPDDRRPNHHPLLLWWGDEAVGVIRVDVAGDVAIFRRVAVRDDVQRRGFGRQLLVLSEAFARDRGCSRVDSHVDHGAVGFYKRCGFHPVSDTPQAGATLLMTKSLREPDSREKLE